MMSEDLTQQEITGYWQNGNTIQCAIGDFCDPYLLEGYRQRRRECHNLEFKPEPGWDGPFDPMQKQNAYSNRLRDIRDGLYLDLAEQIRAGKLIATGFQLPNPSDYPKLIPLHMWPPQEIDEYDSTISANDIQFIKVRICKKPGTESAQEALNVAVEISPPNTVIEDKKAGRPSIREKIQETYEFLKEHGRIDFTKPLKSHTELIQQTVQSLHPEITDTVGMHYKTIFRHLGKKFNADKAKA